MDEKEMIKWGLIALGAYLIYEYIQQQGGLSNVLSGSTTGTGTSPTTCQPWYQMVSGQCIPATTQPSGSTGTPPSQSTGTPPAPPAQTISQKVLAAATSAGEPNNLNFDQWSFYYQQVTGNSSPVDPGSIPPGVYQGAGVLQADGVTPGDRTTPMPLSTWLALMQNQDPSLGLTGFRGMGSFPSYRPHWLN